MARIKEIIDHISDTTNINKETIAKILEELPAVIAMHCSKQEEVHFMSFGRFVPKVYDERIRINPATQQKVVVAKSVSIKFVPTRTYKKVLISSANGSQQG
jgi:nucleoid DNA-binding protein